MTEQRRQHRRVSLGYAGYVMSMDHVLITKCRVADVSRSGMKIRLEYAEDAPDKFILLLTGPRAGVTRLCKVVRREQGAVGVVYDHTVVPEVVQKTSGKSHAARRLAHVPTIEEHTESPALAPSGDDDGISFPSCAAINLSLADFRLLRRIAQFGANFGKLPLKYKFAPETVIALVNKGLVEMGPSGWPGVPAYRVTAMGTRTLHDWKPSQDAFAST